jgi:hypothetical protein
VGTSLSLLDVPATKTMAFDGQTLHVPTMDSFM